MTTALTLPRPSGIVDIWTMWFAQEADKDLDFDDGLEDMDDPDPKPPSRRPLVLILLLLIVASVGYFMLDPGALSTITSMVTAPASKTPAQEATKHTSTEKPNIISAIHPPVPLFQEGQLVAVVTKPAGSPTLKLSGDAEGKQPGPSVKAGELLTILDGTLVNNSWIYLVHTKSGASGWIEEGQIKSQS